MGFSQAGLGLPLILLCQTHAAAQSRPIPPCGQEPFPAYPSATDKPIATFWSPTPLGRDWKPPACTGWTGEGFSTLVTTVARFHGPAETEDMLRRIGAISQLTGMRYWSTTHQSWKTLIVDAHVLTAPQ